MLKRSSLNFIVDLVSFVNLLGLAFTGFIMKYILPPGTGGRGRFLHDGVHPKMRVFAMNNKKATKHNCLIAQKLQKRGRRDSNPQPSDRQSDALAN